MRVRTRLTMGDQPYLWHMVPSVPFYDVHGGPQPMPRRPVVRNASADSLLSSPYGYSFGPPLVDPTYDDVGIPIIPPPNVVEPVIHGRPYVPPHPAPRQRQQIPRNHSVQFRDVECVPTFVAPREKPRRIAPQPPMQEPPRMPPPYRPPPEPPGRPSAPKPAPVIGLDPGPPPQAPPRRRHSQGNLSLASSHHVSSASVDCLDGSVEDLKISVRDRKKLFDSFSSENLLSTTTTAPSSSHARKQAQSRGSVGSQDQSARQFALACAVNDVDKILSMIAECPALAQWRDPVTGYAAIHWAARKGNVDILKALAETEGFDANAKTCSGYTALHLAAQFNRDDFYQVLLGELGADASMRDFSGRKPHQYRQKQEASISANVLSRINVRKTQHQLTRDQKLNRFGSINVRVKKTAEALNHIIGGNSIARILPPDKRPLSVGLTGSTKSLTSSLSSSQEDKTVRRFSSVEPSVEPGDDDVACGFGREWRVKE
ncbi:unnamed protein product [Notodromas monacha]|uniref:Uncharacterized protein n=1 Tax=Notodromas monacha TaxID=399045 RepID=A0A7R9GCA3_9CRUS|nr:unnamed protein product [Notodromas monacha]CAG0915884.1 unnamed protein product [Notodromas monacha]